jgi:DNA polymerase-3 subunit delta'
MSRLGTVFEGLRRAEAEGRLHHAYILSGPESPAKMECVEKLAAHFAAAGGGMFGGGEEAALERIRRGNHPDFHVLKADEGLISVDEIRTLPKILSYPPLESSRRIVVVLSGMNVQASNALLKILEEPPGHTMFFLLCREPTDFLQTIVSRCQVVRFAPLSGEELLAALGDRAGADPEALTAWSDGSLARAELILSTEGASDLQRQSMDMLLALWEASPRIPSSVFQWIEDIDGDENCQITLDTWELVLRDLAFTVAGARANDLLFPGSHERLKNLADAGGLELFAELPLKTTAINRFRVYRKFNGNLRLDFASLLTELQVFSVGKARARE